MKNSEIARVLYILSVYEDMMEGGFKARAYERASRTIEGLTQELSEVYNRGGVDALMEIPDIGEGIAKKIADLLTKGKTKHLEDMKKKIPVEVEELIELEGVGPKTIKTLWQKLKVKNISDLEKAIKSHKIQKLEGFGEKSELSILRSIEFHQKHSGRFLIGYALPMLEEILARLEKVPHVKRAIIGGSARRMKETIGDADFLVATEKVNDVMDFFSKMPEVIHVYSRGKAKVLVRLKNGMDADLQVVEEKSFGAASQYFTGNKDHNVRMRKIAIEKGWKLNEYGVFKNGDKYLFGSDEKELYEKFGMQWIPPEMRENSGEIEAAMEKKLPDLIDYSDLKGDLQVQSKWSDGANSIQEMAEEARRLGLEYIAITDHSQRLAFASGLDEKKLLKQSSEIDKINKKMKGFTVLKGSEVDILKDGSLDLKDDALKKLDIVGASIHSHFNLSREEQTKRILKAMENPNVDILFHPTGRQIQRRESYDYNMEEVFDKAKETGTVLEIDAFPDRLDLKDEHIRFARKKGCKFSIDSDAHSLKHLPYLKFGIGQARRGWLEKKDVINTFDLEKMLKMLK